MVQKGAQPGNSNASKGKAWRDALHKALTRYETDDVKKGEALEKIAYTVIEAALGGSKDAWQEIGNRLDGKPHASIEHSGQLAVTYDEIVTRIMNGSGIEAGDPEGAEPTTH